MFDQIVDRKPDFTIGPAGSPYMFRWHLLPRDKQFNVYLHKIVGNDDDRALHDHPWDSFSLMLAGELLEYTPDGSRFLQRGDVLERAAGDAHRLELVEGPAWTLFVTGPRIREWGFHCPKGS